MFENEYSQYWKTVVQTMLDGLMVVDPEGVILSVNNAFETLTGYGEKELIGKSCKVLACNTCFESRAKGGVKHCQLFNEGQVRHTRCVLKRKDGLPVHVLKNAAVLKDKDGVVVGGVENLADCTELVDRDRVIHTLQRELSIEESFEGIIGKSGPMQPVFELIRSAARSDAPVAVYGESGTGKELVATAIHRLGGRSKGPFVKVNCAALNESLLEISIDVRIITATNKDLKGLMEEGRFREDLYYRVGVIPIYVPPLRERREDIPLLIDAFINRIRIRSEKNITGIKVEALEIMMKYNWPGNIRELINAIEYAFVLCPGGEIDPGHLPLNITGKSKYPSAKRLKKGKLPGSEQKKAILEALENTGGNKTEAAALLGISRVALIQKNRVCYNGFPPCQSPYKRMTSAGWPTPWRFLHLSFPAPWHNMKNTAGKRGFPLDS
ncbi:MAG: sigma-54-dependent Fis family transcriptional regulator [Desulfobacteraceae bacterium 4572_87]|nr:MAG: sigma-54-dependent Fis family transcriptional regulator [Desulfobacteraceae bacterium 4572_87]